MAVNLPRFRIFRDLAVAIEVHLLGVPPAERGFMLIAQVRPNRFGSFLERRRQPRLYLPASARVSRSGAANDVRLAYMRDANIRGAFFFCDLNVMLGETLQVHLAPQAAAKLIVNCEASVVRVERPVRKGLTGIAVEFHRFEVEDPKSAQDSLVSSFTDWDADTFARMFAQRLKLETCAFRVQGAA